MSGSTLLTDQDRVLTLLHMLDDDAAEHALRAMDADVASRLRTLLEDFSGRAPSAKQQQRVLDEFERFFQFARKYSAASPAGANAGENGNPGEAQYSLTGDSTDDLEKMNVFQVTSALEEETPRTAAILLRELSPERNADILSLMRSDLRSSVVRELSLNPTAPPVLLQQVAQSTAERASTLPPERPDEPNPEERMAEVLRATDKPNRMEMLKTLQEQDEAMGASILKLLFRFEDLVDLEDRQIRAVLGKVETATISTAMFGCDPAISNKIMSNLSKRARLTLEEELSFLSHVPEKQLEDARNSVSDAIAEVEMEME